MEDLENQKFERSWREALSGEGAPPNEKVWSGIEHQLGHEQMKRRVIFYQRLAAASLLFALLAGAFGLYWRDRHYQQLADASKAESQKLKSSQESQATIKPNPLPGDQAAVDTKKSLNNPTKVDQVTHSTRQKGLDMEVAETGKQKSSDNRRKKYPVNDSPAVVAAQLNSNEASDSDIRKIVNDDLEKEAQLNRDGYYASRLSDIENAPLFDIELNGQPQNAELVRKLPAIPAAFMSQRQNKYDEKWWAAAGASAGTYNPNLTNTGLSSAGFYSTSPSMLPSSIPSNYGTSYSVALTAAHRISKRWVLQSGMQYMARSIDYTSNFTSYAGNKMTASVADYAPLASTVAVTSPYQLESRSEYISIPVQAGYVLVDRKFSLLINSGVASDIFIRNTLTDLSGQRASYSESGGASSPYRTFNWSALASTELSYKLGARYRLALVPGMRFSLNQIMKSDQSTQGIPLIWDVGFRFRYIFK